MNPTTEDLALARDLLRGCLRPASMADLIGDSDNLADAGVDSLATIELITRCEDALGRDLTDDESTTLDSITAIARLLSANPGGQGN
ncbi:acyl carrier protein [Streptomyces sp. NBC_00503]|uniref:acyl carrier protein n=1 Tax=Streptomyces sp. NBC_00503 TaxID=2903659 RepID=UPI002E809D3B|nr:acyl carrier protein [Streptomyces sp. NBC_00503]WUD84091.1 acyl carrier protein [Streptomyces sp. NBC_00503]